MLAKLWRYTFYRNFSNSVVRRNLEKKTTETSPQSDSSSQGFALARMPSNFEKKILVLSGRYKTEKEIPKLISAETLENSKTKLRIKIANLMMLVTVIACGVVIYNGKAARKERIKKWGEDQEAARAEHEQKTAAQ